jgi:hypothetical protein
MPGTIIGFFNGGRIMVFIAIAPEGTTLVRGPIHPDMLEALRGCSDLYSLFRIDYPDIRELNKETGAFESIREESWRDLLDGVAGL